MEKKTFFISTSIPYVNARPHVGHALEFVQADVIARFRRLMGRNVFFLSGTDDNALKNVQAAEAAGVPVEEYVKENSAIFEELLRRLNISHDDFIRTGFEERHRLGAQRLWSRSKKEDIYKKKYRGLYCVGCEEFKKEKDLVHGECPEHPGKKLEEVEEENYFFRLSAYQDALHNLISSGELQIVPAFRKNEMLAFIEAGLEDFSISRSKERARGWGIPVPGDDSQTIYVWFDALSNYINALGYAKDDEKFKTFWQEGEEVVHIIGKGINRFHTIYWPAMLLSAGVRPPTKAVVHGYVTGDRGIKMSKSLGNVADPALYIEEFGAEAVRYFLIREIPTFEDGSFSRKRFVEAYNANLANGLGNLVARVLKLSETHLEGPVDIPTAASFPKEYTEALEGFEITKAADYVWSRIKQLDEKIAATEPFRVVKTDKEKGAALIKDIVTELYWIGRLLYPFLPQANAIIKEAIRQNKKPETLFPRIEA